MLHAHRRWRWTFSVWFALAAAQPVAAWAPAPATPDPPATQPARPAAEPPEKPKPAKEQGPSPKPDVPATGPAQDPPATQPGPADPKTGNPGEDQDGSAPADPLQLKRPRREDRDSPNLPTVLGHGIEPGNRISRGATIVSKGRQAFLITVLDALAFESGQRTVDIALVEAAGGKECAVIPNVDSFRFRWIADVPDHCAVELREEEIALIRKCEVWAFFDQPEIKEPEGDGNPAAGAQLSATGMGVELRRGEGPRRYDAIDSMTKLDPDAANTLNFAPIDPPADARLAGTCFVHDMGSGWVWLAGIGTEGNGAAPMTTVLGEPAVARIVDSVADGSARPVTELLMLERHLRRTGIPPGYAGLREFLSESGAEGLVRWKEVQASRGNHESAYRIERRTGVDGDRVVAAVSRNPSHDLSMNLEGSGAGARWRGADVASAPDAAVGVSAQDMRALGPDEAFELTLRIDNPSTETSRILVIEATAVGAQTPALPTAAPR